MTDAGVKVVTTGIRVPRMNALMERWIQTCRTELLDRTLIWNQSHLPHTALVTFVCSTPRGRSTVSRSAADAIREGFGALLAQFLTGITKALTPATDDVVVLIAKRKAPMWRVVRGIESTLGEQWLRPAPLRAEMRLNPTTRKTESHWMVVQPATRKSVVYRLTVTPRGARKDSRSSIGGSVPSSSSRTPDRRLAATRKATAASVRARDAPGQR